ncbi:MAG: electron transport complex subunit RsxC [Desulfuromonadaceae bacterium]|nr:electron transport complex subunit RsxC [Desulfuromonadaceae bacterium]MDD2854594.1 electron transport complex subunit RsxC [Desulfuromonadaceae bacterium]
MSSGSFMGGIHLNGHKELTSGLKTIQARIPDRLYIPLSQHIGAPCAPLVVVGDSVKKGQKIGVSKGFVSAPVHASTSGTVVAIEVMEHPGGSFVPCIVIDNNGLEEWVETVKPTDDPTALSPEEIRGIILEAGIVGMGGATFPSHVKYTPVEGKSADTVILNGIECEPYLTSDHRLMLEKPDRIVAGLRYIMKSVGCNRGIIAIEDNKMDAVVLLKKAAERNSNISIVVMKEKYPQGSEKQLIFGCTGREVPAGGLPIAVGVIVNNVGTAAAVADAVEFGRPLIERFVTVSGDGILHPANYLVRIGTLFSDLITESGGITGETERVISGGPMMGKTVFSTNVPIVKGSSGIVVMKKADKAGEHIEYPCVRCAKCVDACPAFLEPTSIVKLAKRSRWNETETANVMSCIECGSCVYVCPSQIPLIQYIRRAKQAVMAGKAKAAAK